MKYNLTILVMFCCICLSQGQSCDIEGIYHSTFEDVKQILDSNNCGSCHANENTLGNWNYNTYSSFLTSGDCGKPMILHGDASFSYFYRRLGGGSDVCGDVEDGIHTLSEEEFRQIENWINFGAPEDCVPLYSDVKLILDDNGCNSCHTDNPQSWRYDTYINLMSNDLDENCNDVTVVVKGDSESSLLYDKINNDGFIACGEEMNGTSGPMSYEDAAKIRDWINSGAFETSASLPVILTDFSVYDEYDKVYLRWTTEIEIATEKFVIERSSTGQNFMPFAELKSEGSANQGYNYNLVDVNPNVGDNYYRLKIIDLDGTFNYSNILFVRVKSEETVVTVYPNPAVSLERITVEWLPRANEESTYLNIVDVNGQNLHRKIIFEGTNYVRLPRLLDGVYYVIVEDLFGGFILERVVIIN